MAQVPRLGALAVVVQAGNVLLVQRANPPDAGLWGYPGGHVEWGETVDAAAIRELYEETGVQARAGPVLGVLDAIHRNSAGDVTSHYLLTAVACLEPQGEAVLSEETRAVAWVAVADVLRGDRAYSRGVDRVLRMALAQVPRIGV
ncbi:MAG: NUDIX hydrolase [Pseudomonadota bacterium]